MIERGESRPGRVIVLNGGSSAGKTTLGRKLQGTLEGSWLLLGVDVLIWMLPPRLIRNPEGLAVEDGVITRGNEFMRIYAAFRHSVAALAEDGIDILIDDVTLEAAADQRRWDESLEGLDVCWVAVRCAPDVAEARERTRGDRAWGTARRHALTVHEGVRYDVEVDSEALDLAQSVGVIADAVKQRWGVDSVAATNDAPELPVLSALTTEGEIARAPWET